MTFHEFTHDQLVVSPFNVRRHVQDATSTEGLEASIAAHGLLMPLVVHPMDDGRYGVLAGGRRWHAIGRLISANTLPADWPIHVALRDGDAAYITELSLHENLRRLDLHQWEIHAAVVRAHTEGAGIDEIAHNLGQPVLWVRQQLALGRLEPTILQALIDEKITLEQARAYAATHDQALQLAAFSHFSQLGQWHSQPNQIRAWLKVGDRELDRVLRFVGDVIYRAAGGRFELDLFADVAETRGRVADEGLLRQLAEDKMAEIRLHLREETGRGQALRFVDKPPTGNEYESRDLQIEPRTKSVGDRRRIHLPDGDVVGTIDLTDAGDVDVRWWWASRKALSAAQKAKPSTVDTAEPASAVPDAAGFHREGHEAQQKRARAAVREEHGLAADGLQVVRSLRREALRALLVNDAVDGGELARDYLIWAQLRQERGGPDRPKAREAAVGARGLSGAWQTVDESGDPDVISGFLEHTVAHDRWESACALIEGQAFMQATDQAESLRLFLTADADIRRLAAAILAGIALLRSANTPGWRIGAHDVLAREAGASDAALRTLITPTAAFCGLFSRLQRIGLVERLVDRTTIARWAKLKDAELSDTVSAALAAKPAWVHPLITFPAGLSATDDQAAAEPAGVAE